MHRRISPISSGCPPVEGSACTPPMFRGSPCNGINDMAGNCSDRVPLKFPKPRAPVSHRAVMVTGLATISPEEYSLIIRDVPPDERNQFRVH